MDCVYYILYGLNCLVAIGTHTDTINPSIDFNVYSFTAITANVSYVILQYSFFVAYWC